MITYQRGNHRIEVHAEGTAPNCKPVLHVVNLDNSQVVAKVELDDFLGSAQALYEAELEHNLQIDREKKKFAKKVKKIRKALGYSYP